MTNFHDSLCNEGIHGFWATNDDEIFANLFDEDIAPVAPDSRRDSPSGDFDVWASGSKPISNPTLSKNHVDPGNTSIHRESPPANAQGQRLGKAQRSQHECLDLDLAYEFALSSSQTGLASPVMSNNTSARPESFQPHVQSAPNSSVVLRDQPLRNVHQDGPTPLPSNFPVHLNLYSSAEANFNRQPMVLSPNLPHDFNTFSVDALEIMRHGSHLPLQLHPSDSYPMTLDEIDFHFLDDQSASPSNDDRSQPSDLRHPFQLVPNSHHQPITSGMFPTVIPPSTLRLDDLGRSFGIHGDVSTVPNFNSNSTFPYNADFPFQINSQDWTAELSAATPVLLDQPHNNFHPSTEAPEIIMSEAFEATPAHGHFLSNHIPLGVDGFPSWSHIRSNAEDAHVSFIHPTDPEVEGISIISPQSVTLRVAGRLMN
jgi:hypothetical protein